ncbi:MAG: hypothetical protein GXP21_03480 [Gammaproteobacteria bacterium]|nr:hypothetical protein [Gammaproteobacteria bacterium]
MMTASPRLVIHRAKQTGIFLLLALTLLLSGAGLASGGGNHGGGGSDGSNPKKLNAERYSLGKQVYKNNVNCAGCIINQSQLSKNEASRLYKQVKKNSNLNSSLSKKERKALKYYMRERFKL